VGLLLAMSSLVQQGCSSQTLVAFVSPNDSAVSPDLTARSEDGSNDATVSDNADTTSPDDPTPLPSDPSRMEPIPDMRPGPDTTDALAVPPADIADAPADPPSVLPDLAPSSDRAGDVAPDALPVDRAGTDARADRTGDVPDSATIKSQILFYDSFDDGYAATWSRSESSDGPVTDNTDGTNKIATLDASQADYSRLRCNLDGTYFTEVNITASMKVRIDRAPISTRTVRLDVRQASSTVNIFYGVGVSVATDGSITKASVLKKVPDRSNNYTECELAAGPGFSPTFPLGEWHAIKITVSGTTSAKLTAYFDNLAVATFTDDCTSQLVATDGATVENGGCLAGQTGLGIQVEKGIKASVDDVLVMAP
jgi:hypothetical protein